MTVAGDAVLALAYTQVGTQSGDEYWAWWGADLGSYCACFVSWCGWHAGYPVCPIDGSGGFVLVSNGTIHSYEQGEAKSTLDLQPGDAILFSWYYWDWENGLPVITEDPWVGWIAGDHTGLFSHWIDRDSGRFATVEGNTSGGVVAYREDRYTSQVCGWWRTPSVEGAWPPEPEPAPRITGFEEELDMIIGQDQSNGRIWLISGNTKLEFPTGGSDPSSPGGGNIYVDEWIRQVAQSFPGAPELRLCALNPDIVNRIPNVLDLVKPPVSTMTVTMSDEDMPT